MALSGFSTSWDLISLFCELRTTQGFLGTASDWCPSCCSALGLCLVWLLPSARVLPFSSFLFLYAAVIRTPCPSPH